MSAACCLSTAAIMDVFVDELAAHSGTVTDCCQTGDCLIARSLLPFVREARPRDRLQGGVALKAVEGQVWVHPYVFREVCSNGAIMARTLDARQLDFDGQPPEDERLLGEAIAACCEPEVFAESVEDIRSTLTVTEDVALSMLSMLARLDEHASEDLAAQIIRRFMETEDRSRFGLMNAVTSVARDTRDPQLRWRLEEFGGGIAVGSGPRVPRDGARRRRTVPTLCSVNA